ncbi:EsaB/YukD family protein [Nocardioides acrostichi]|uniref:EsaB/YukD family protein n=1 Tax=Nocardioides acrostichi TaxID=2784339 RepID=A0A930V478_9ACTN|nr:EsaB/YukD family protein [Nocardioides acrostichi]MBF4163546.1 EsaB/YukD family protein [Nocardioides acrostichi]
MSSLLRVSVVADARRLDVAVPRGVPVVELLPDLARSLGVLDPASAHLGHHLVTTAGRPLDTPCSLGEQGVVDGAVLALVPGSAGAPPVVHDDPAAALAEAVSARPEWTPLVARASSPAAAVVPAGVGLLLALLPRTGSAAVAATLMTLGVLGAHLAPTLALAAARATDTAVRARWAERLWLALAGAVGILVVAGAPLAATTGPPGWALAACCCVVLALRSRQYHALAPVALARAAALVGGVLALLLVGLDPAGRVWCAGLCLTSAGLLVATSSRAPNGVVRERVLDIVETVALLALAPLLVLALGLVPGV